MSAVHQVTVSCFKGLLFVGACLHQLSMAQISYGTGFHREAKAAEQASEFLGLCNASSSLPLVD